MVSPGNRVSSRGLETATTPLSDLKNGTAAMIPGYETDMPAYKEILSDADIWAVLSYIESTWASSIRERQQRMNRQEQ